MDCTVKPMVSIVLILISIDCSSGDDQSIFIILKSVGQKDVCVIYCVIPPSSGGICKLNYLVG